jgi:hypothetical protein
MAAITEVPVRARISIGGLSVETPYVLSFNVNITRGQISTFDAVLKVEGSAIRGQISGDFCKIAAGVGSPRNTIYQGVIKKAKISPCWDDPKFVMLHISGEDILANLRGKKFTRRCRGTQSSWVSITGVVRPGLKSSKFIYQNDPTMFLDPGKPISQSELIHYPGTDKTQSSLTPAPSGNQLAGLSLIIENVQTEAEV